MPEATRTSSEIFQDSAENPSGPVRHTSSALALTAIILSAFSLRTAVTSLTPLLGTVGSSLGFGSGLAGVLGMMPTLMFAAAGPFSPLVVKRVGLQRAALLAMTFATLGLAARSLAGTPGLVVASGLALLGMGMGNVVIPPLVKYYFPTKIGAVSMAYITALQIGTALPPLLAVPAAHTFGWRGALALWAVAAFLAVVPWLVLVRAGGAEPHSTGADPHHVPGQVWRSPLAWGMMLMFSMTSLNTYAMFTWLPKVLTDAGHSKGYAGVLLSLFSAMGFVSAIVAPQLAARLRNPIPLVIFAVVTFVLGYVGLAFNPGSSLAILWVVLVGFGPTTFPLALTLINLRTRSAQGSAALSSFTQGLGYLLACLGPIVFGALRTSTGGWHASFAFLGLALVLLMTGGALACRPGYLEDSWHARPQGSDITN